MFGMSLFALGLLFAKPPRFSEQHLPYRAQWGGYTVQVDKKGRALKIFSQTGKTVYSIVEDVIRGVDFIRWKKGALPALHVLSQVDGAGHWGYTDYVFVQDQEKQVRNVLLFCGDNGALEDFVDLDGDGRMEIKASNSALVYDGMSYAYSPFLVTILAWDGKRYTNQTRRYADYVVRRAEDYKQKLLEELDPDNKSSDVNERHQYLAGYYGDMVLAGKAVIAHRWLLNHLDKADRQWFLSHEASWQKNLAGSHTKVFLTSSTTLKSEIWYGKSE